MIRVFVGTRQAEDVTWPDMGDGVYPDSSLANYNAQLLARVQRRYPDHDVAQGWLDQAYDTESDQYNDSAIVEAIRREADDLNRHPDRWVFRD